MRNCFGPKRSCRPDTTRGDETRPHVRDDQGVRIPSTRKEVSRGSVRRLRSAGANQQPCRADQPDVPAPGEGAIRVAATSDAGSLRGRDVGQHLEGTNHRPRGDDPSFKHDRDSQDTRRDEETTLGRVKTRWCSARSVPILGQGQAANACLRLSDLAGSPKWCSISKDALTMR